MNTLYTRCEETLSPSRALCPTRAGEVGLGTRGVLLIIKDAGAAGGDEGAFWAWIANGEGLSMGKKGGKDILVVVNRKWWFFPFLSN